VEGLEDEADAAGADVVGIACDEPLAGHLDPAGVRPVQPAQQVQERRLARPRAPDDRHQLAAGDVERGAVEDPPGRAGAPIALDEISGAQRVHHS
jgi:hypothetical protein